MSMRRFCRCKSIYGK